MQRLKQALLDSHEVGVPLEEVSKTELTALKDLLELRREGTIRIEGGKAYLLLGEQMFRQLGSRKICKACELSTNSPVGFRGPLDAEVVVVAEAPGKEEEAGRRPLIGPAGRETSSALKHAGLDENDILFMNPVLCRLPTGMSKPPKDCVLTCSRLYLSRFLEKHPRKLIVAMGNTACFALNPTEWDMAGIEGRHGVPHWSNRFNCLLLPTLHPASMLKREPNKVCIQTFGPDMKRVKAIKDRGFKYSSPKVDVEVLRTLDSLDTWRTACDEATSLVVDIETTGRDFHRDQILSIAFSVKPGEALTIPIMTRLVTLTDKPARIRELAKAYLIPDPVLEKILGKKLRKQGEQPAPADWVTRVLQRSVTYDMVTQDTQYDPQEHAKYLRPAGWHCYWNADAWKQIYSFLKHVLQESTVPKSMHNGNFDWKFLKFHYDIEVTPFADDTILAHQLIDENGQHGLDAIAADCLGYVSHKKPVRDEHTTTRKAWQLPAGDYSTIGPQRLHQYNGEDTSVQFEVTEHLVTALRDNDMHGYYSRLLMPIWEIIRRMEYHGLCVDSMSLDYAKDTIGLATSEALARVKEFSDDPEFNPGSTKQLADLLYRQWNLTVPGRTKGGNPQTDKEALEKLRPARPDFVEALFRWRSLSKDYKTFISQLVEHSSPVDHRIHPQYAFASDREWGTDRDVGARGARTGRLSTKNPSIQVIRKPLRPLIWAGDGRVFIESDYRTMELRVWAELSGDTGLRDAVNSEDVHRSIAAQLFQVPANEVTSKQRAIGKTFAFGAAYGAEPPTLSARAGISIDEAGNILTALKRTFATGFAWMDEQGQLALRQGYVTTLLGRRRRPSGAACADGGLRAAAVRQAGNAPVQGSASEICLVGWLKADRALKAAGLDVHSAIQVHDSVVFDALEEHADKAVEIIRNEMSSPIGSLGIEMPVDIGFELSENSTVNYYPYWGGDLNVDAFVKGETTE